MPDGRDVNPGEMQGTKFDVSEDWQSSQTSCDREDVEREIANLQKEGLGLVEEVKGLQARVTEIKNTRAHEGLILPDDSVGNEDSATRIRRLEERARAEELRLKTFFEEDDDIDVMSDDHPPRGDDVNVPQQERASKRADTQSPDLLQIKRTLSGRGSRVRSMSPVRFGPDVLFSEKGSPETRASAVSPSMRRFFPMGALDSQPCRLGIEVIAIQCKPGFSLPSCYLKLVHGTLKEKTEPVHINPVCRSVGSLPSVSRTRTDGGFETRQHESSSDHIVFHHKCSLQVQEKHLVVELRQKVSGVHIRSNVLGRATIDVGVLETRDSVNALHGDGDVPQPHLLILSDTKGHIYEPVEYVELRIVKVRPPGPEESLNVLVGTWNMADSPPPCAEELQGWLLPEKVQEAGLVVVGTQECQYTRRNMDGIEYESTEQDWVDTISTVIGDSHTMYRGISLGKTRLCIWTRLDVLAGIHHFETDAKWTGYPMIYSSKGGVAALLSVWDTTIVFVNCHLAAHMGAGYLQKRNQDYSDIVSSISLGSPHCGLLNQFHHCVWMGDVNYRLDLSETFGDGAVDMKPSPACHDHVLTLVRGRQFAELLKRDELIQAREGGQAFVGFEEGHIEHAPTFKVRKRVGVAYKTKRLPAYTDRIMWRSLLPTLRTTCHQLWSAEDVATSDHKPVAALLELDMRPPRPEWWPRDGVGAHMGDARAKPARSKRQSEGRSSSSGTRSPDRVTADRLPSDSTAGSLVRAHSSARSLQIHRFSSAAASPEEEPARPHPAASTFHSSLWDTFRRPAAAGKRWTHRFSSTFRSVRSLGSALARTPSSREHWGGTKNALPSYTLQLSSLRASDLAVGCYAFGSSVGAADPYVSFFGEGLAAPVRTEVVRNSRDPAWACSNLTLALSAASLEALRWEYLTAAVMHSARGEVLPGFQQGSPDLCLGVGVILLHDLLQSAAAEIELAVPLLSAGLPKGTLHCTVKIAQALPTPLATFTKQRHKAKRPKPSKRSAWLPTCLPCSWRQKAVAKPLRPRRLSASSSAIAADKATRDRPHRGSVESCDSSRTGDESPAEWSTHLLPTATTVTTEPSCPSLHRANPCYVAPLGAPK